MFILFIKKKKEKEKNSKKFEYWYYPRHYWEYYAICGIYICYFLKCEITLNSKICLPLGF